MKELRKHSFLILLFMSIAAVSLYGLICDTEAAEHDDRNTTVARAIHHMKDRLVHPKLQETVPASIVIGEKEEAFASNGEKAEKVSPADAEPTGPGKNSDKKGEDENKEEDADKEEKEDVKNPKFELVAEDYFDDALFIGDSRVAGFGMYSGLENATFYAHKGFQIYTFQTKPLVDTPYGKITVPEALLLQQGQFKKVYIMFGLNEMGWGTDEQFAQYYYNVIDTVKGTQPDAVVYVQSIMHVSKETSDSSPIYGNEAIDARNEWIQKIAADENVYYLNLNEIFTDEEGALPAEFSGDGVHLKAAYIDLWKQYLMAHAIVREESVSSNETD